MIGPKWAINEFDTIKTTDGVYFAVLGYDSIRYKEHEVKLFIFSTTGRDLTIIDSSPDFHLGRFGNMYVKDDVLTINEGGNFCSRFYEYNYKINPPTKKTILVSLDYSCECEQEPDSVHSVSLYQYYDVLKQTLTISSYLLIHAVDDLGDFKEAKQKTKIIDRKMIGLVTSLKSLDDSYDLTKVFIDESSKEDSILYNKMTSYSLK